ncbi:type VII secretion integral membrane protein EccD [Microbacterium sp. ARD32]|uniref:type VII secretion integral membrane protein EccD n=1 Tax=Microbacterium sp. ARD32 TaxID=2962577 RepID=UPI002881B0CE|nr:type VII secretion integral membrane protein EccD [Microbacterium sp. ARD32]MDT0156125.1 type VII secretion integral membrane protein EccD [Microbacterium sp. ARD32]
MPSQTTAAAPSQLVRLSVQWESERIDVGVPGGVPVAEVLPSLTRRLRMLDSSSASAGFRLVRAEGSPLDPDRTLAAQNVHDGDFLVLEQGATAALPKRYDDLVEAVADVVEENAPAWSVQNTVTTATVVASVLLLLGLVPAVWAWVDAGTVVTAAGAGAAAVVLLICALVMDRTGAPPQAAMALALVSSVYAGVGGYTALPGGPGWGLPVVLAAAGMLVFGIVTMLGLRSQREYGLIPVTLGGILLVVGAVIEWLGAPVASTLAAAMSLAGIAGLGAPWVALASVPLRVVSARDDSEVYDAPAHISPQQVAALYVRAHRYQVSLRIALCLIVLVAIVPVVASGFWGLLLSIVTLLGMLLGTRQVYSRFDIVVVVAGVLTGASLALVAAVIAHPTWIGGLVIGLAASAACVIVIVLLSTRVRMGLTRFADFAEWATIALLLPLAIIAGGWF